eukprot:c7136_g1_i1.p1 GENE.c7136_g1_i1~~c7136_g1_i1.p1  ORF type:complete len:202 (-),score=46.91 c7136_g1_i1:12-617(-)
MEEEVLRELAMSSDVEGMRRSIAAGADVNKPLQKNRTVLMSAALKGQDEAVRFLVEVGAEVNSTNSDGETALMLAAMRDHFGCVELLLQHQADPTIRNSKGQIAFDLCPPTSKSRTLLAQADQAPEIEGHTPPLIIQETTRDYQAAARRVVLPTDVVLEIGSAAGITTDMLSRMVKDCIGVDSSAFEINSARARFPHIEVH